jgi:hypothetical protein
LADPHKPHLLWLAEIIPAGRDRRSRVAVQLATTIRQKNDTGQTKAWGRLATCRFRSAAQSEGDGSLHWNAFLGAFGFPTTGPGRWSKASNLSSRRTRSRFSLDAGVLEIFAISCQARSKALSP